MSKLSAEELASAAVELGDIGVADDDARFAMWARHYGPRICFTIAALERELGAAKDSYDGAMEDCRSAVMVLIRRIKGEKPWASAAEWVRINHPGLWAEHGGSAEPAYDFARDNAAIERDRTGHSINRSWCIYRNGVMVHRKRTFEAAVAFARDIGILGACTIRNVFAPPPELPLALAASEPAGDETGEKP